MKISTIELQQHDLQRIFNNAKDDVIEAINKHHGLNIDPCEYMFVSQCKGCLGRAWDKLFGKQEDDVVVTRLIRVKRD